MESIDNIKERKPGKALWIVGLVFMIISLVLFVVFNLSVLDGIASGDSIGLAFGIVLGLIFYFLPGAIFSLISFIFNVIAWRKDSKSRTRLVTFVLSMISMLSFAIEFIILFV